MRINHEAVTNSLGPGRRYAIWTQGCERRCPGCINPEGWDLQGGYGSSIEELKRRILSHGDLTGITISGGEPLLQLEEVWGLAEWAKSETGLDIMLFSGFRLEELKTLYGERIRGFLNLLDIFVDGEYIEERNDNSMYRGSDNQKLYFFTDKYLSWREKILSSKKRDFSFEVLGSGDVYLIGIPPKGFYQALVRQIAVQTRRKRDER